MLDFNRIKAHYKTLESVILAERKDRHAIDPYEWQNIADMTPIEWALWSDMRCIGAVMYPQYPVGKYFVDFANPKAKVAIECDGKEFHLDKFADYERQKAIESMGWSVYRFTGAECFQDQEDVRGEEKTSYKRLMAIAACHGIAQGLRPSEEYMQTVAEEAMREIYRF